MGKLSFGYTAGLPEGIRAAWGARLIVDQGGYTDFLHDRQGHFGDDADVDKLFAWVNSGAFEMAREKAGVLLRGYEMNTRKREEFVLYEDDLGRIVGNTNGSAGYLYVAAWLHMHVDTGGTSLRPRPGETAEDTLNRVVEAVREKSRWPVEGHSRVDADGTEWWVEPHMKNLSDTVGGRADDE